MAILALVLALNFGYVYGYDVLMVIGGMYVEQGVGYTSKVGDSIVNHFSGISTFVLLSIPDYRQPERRSDACCEKRRNFLKF